ADHGLSWFRVRSILRLVSVSLQFRASLLRASLCLLRLQNRVKRGGHPCFRWPRDIAPVAHGIIQRGCSIWCSRGTLLGWFYSAFRPFRRAHKRLSMLLW